MLKSMFKSIGRYILLTTVRIDLVVSWDVNWHIKSLAKDIVSDSSSGIKYHKEHISTHVYDILKKRQIDEDDLYYVSYEINGYINSSLQKEYEKSLRESKLAEFSNNKIEFKYK